MNRKEFVLILVITFIVIMIWLGYDLFFKTKASIQTDAKLQSILDPINPDFDQAALEIIKKVPDPLPLINTNVGASPSAKP